MGRPRILPDKATLARWRREGMTHAEMAERVYQETGHRVTTMAISVAMNRYGLSEPMKRYAKEIPWRVKVVHAGETPARMLRLLARRRAGESLTERDDKMLTNWLARLKKENAVVAYDPESGFHYVEKEPGDGTAIPIRPYEVKIKK